MSFTWLSETGDTEEPPGESGDVWDYPGGRKYRTERGAWESRPDVDPPVAWVGGRALRTLGTFEQQAGGWPRVERTPLGVVTQVGWNTETETIRLVVEGRSGNRFTIEGKVIEGELGAT